MSAREVIEHGIDVERGTAAVAAMNLYDDHTDTKPPATVRTRATRSDAGKPRQKPGIVVIRHEMSIDGAAKTLQIAVQEGDWEYAHRLVDAIKAASK